jgi:hypothetical protein
MVIMMLDGDAAREGVKGLFPAILLEKGWGLFER